MTTSTSLMDGREGYAWPGWVLSLLYSTPSHACYTLYGRTPNKNSVQTARAEIPVSRSLEKPIVLCMCDKINTNASPIVSDAYGDSIDIHYLCCRPSVERLHRLMISVVCFQPRVSTPTCLTRGTSLSLSQRKDNRLAKVSVCEELRRDSLYHRFYSVGQP